MGVLNVTPDSFSDGGKYLDADRAVEHALAMEAAGADVIDVGGESARPIGAVEIPVEVELARVTPVLERLGRRLRVPISIDTRRAEVARVALESGAAIINDITSLEHDREMAPLAARMKCAVVLMHMRGGPANHIKFAHYRDVVREVVEYLDARARFAAAAGIARSRIIVDPGLGFAKNAQHNLKIAGRLAGPVCARLSRIGGSVAQDFRGANRRRIRHQRGRYGSGRARAGIRHGGCQRAGNCGRCVDRART